MRKPEKFNVIFSICLAAFLSVCAYFTWNTYTSYRDARVGAYIAYPKEGTVNYTVDQFAYVKDPKELGVETEYSYIGELSFRKNYITPEIFPLNSTVKVIVGEYEEQGEVIDIIYEKNQLGSMSTEYVYYIGFDSDHVDDNIAAYQVIYECDPIECEYTLPASAVSVDSDMDCVFVIVPKDGVFGTEYVTRKVLLSVWPRSATGNQLVQIKELPAELTKYPVLIKTDRALRTRANLEGTGISVNLMEYEWEE
ncbi:MAG: hypothetical protein Q4C42_03900 [Clostridia bacterium]|nr:hypothetical protein [Clostridia bacterium]